MQPTMKLRLVRRKGSQFIGKTEDKEWLWLENTLILQQQWEDETDDFRKEWIDVPIEEEA